MPEQPDDFEPTEADIDLLIEETTGKPVKPRNLAAGITSMRQCIAQLEAEKTKLLDRMVEDVGDSLRDHRTSINKDLATSRERLSHYEAQSGRQNRVRSKSCAGVKHVEGDCVQRWNESP